MVRRRFRQIINLKRQLYSLNLENAVFAWASLLIMVSQAVDSRLPKRLVIIGDLLNFGTGAVFAGLDYFVLGCSGSLRAATGTMFGFYFATILCFYFPAHANRTGCLGLV